MPRWLEITLILVLFAAGMTALSWGVNATVPAGIDWVADRLGIVSAWALFLLLMAVCAFLAWRGHRPVKGSRGRVEGR
ncbi:hypothetical protein Q8W71_29825 [Methylobacterium sp. NEAU 140]|uniref:hypothetical protein n=1 Tax=Methylobacterium sp. NEAU 140 TaxID=3064945 RepID=UPI002732E8BD|nr:hypothetical protein [Methylobacterium sp. NEAU 140]MDP4026808.1 hypothetical protein [Methylobacterium sp. NEAU 140]